MEPDHTHVTLSQWQGGSQMGYIDAELDLAPIDKVDVRNELRPFTVLRAPEANFPNFASYCNLCVSVT